MNTILSYIKAFFFGSNEPIEPENFDNHVNDHDDNPVDDHAIDSSDEFEDEPVEYDEPIPDTDEETYLDEPIDEPVDEPISEEIDTLTPPSTPQLEEQVHWGFYNFNLTEIIEYDDANNKIIEESFSRKENAVDINVNIDSIQVAYRIVFYFDDIRILGHQVCGHQFKITDSTRRRYITRTIVKP